MTPPPDRVTQNTAHQPAWRAAMGRPGVATPRQPPSIHPVLSLQSDAKQIGESLKAAVTAASGYDRDSLWPELSDEFALDHHLNQQAVQAAVRKYTRNPEWLSAAQDRLSLYLPYFLEEVRRRNLPAELALLPIVESTLDPAALSPRGALGLWQFMPDTANRFGLSRDWWHDSRQDTVASTRAALDYLELLHAQFGDWLLTLAAYNAGEGTVARSLPASGQRSTRTRFFEMRSLPTETRNYVPRVLALAAIIKNPEKYDVELPSVGRDIQFGTIRTDKPVDLQRAASILNVAPSELVALNPGLHRRATPPEGTHNLLVPARIADHAQATIDAMAADESFAPVVRYTVQRGDTLGRIAKNFDSSVTAIRQLNGLRSDRIIAAAVLQIPQGRMLREPGRHAGEAAGSPPAQVVAGTTYRVQRGDSLSVIAARFDVPVTSLKQANRLRSDGIRANSTLKIPTMMSVAAADAQPRGSARSTGTHAVQQADVAWNMPAVKSTTAYRVARGDSLSTIASRYGMTSATLKALNGLTSDMIHANQTLRVPSGADSREVATTPSHRETYRVRNGDTLWSIARRHDVSHHELMRVNGLNGRSVIQPGRALKIPQPTVTDIAGG